MRTDEPSLSLDDDLNVTVYIPPDKEPGTNTGIIVGIGMILTSNHDRFHKRLRQLVLDVMEYAAMQEKYGKTE